MSTISPYVGDGTTKQFDITFDYDGVETIKVRLDGVDAPSFIFVNPSRIELPTAPATGVLVEVYRFTDVSEPVVTFEDGAIIRDVDLNKASSQPRMRVEEMASELEALSSRVVVVPGAEAGLSIPTLASRPNKYLGFDGSGNFVVAEGTADSPGLRPQLLASTGSSYVGFLQSGTGAIARTAQDKLRDVVSVKDFNAKGDGTTNDYAAIVLARDAAIATGKPLHFPDGTYAFGTRLELGYDNLRVTFSGGVTLKPTHAGVAVSFDGGVAGSIENLYFGWANPPTIQGNVGTTDAVYTRAIHHSMISARIRDCVTGARVIFSVETKFKLTHSSNQGGWTILAPTNGLIVDKRAAAEATTGCDFDLIIEGMSGMGVVLTSAQHNNFWGTSEGNGAGGVSLAAESINNNFYNFFCEQNGSAAHWTVASNENVFVNCTGGGPTNSGTNTNTISGIRNLFLRGKFYQVTETGYYNEWRQTALGAAVALGTNSIREKCHDGAGGEIADLYPPATITTPALSGLWVAQTANGERAHGYYKDRSGVVHLVGSVKSGAGGSVIFTLPVGFRPGGTLYAPYDNVTAGTIGRLAVAANGQVQHLSGDTGTVALAGISFPAEG